MLHLLHLSSINPLHVGMAQQSFIFSAENLYSYHRSVTVAAIVKLQVQTLTMAFKSCDYNFLKDKGRLRQFEAPKNASQVCLISKASVLLLRSKVKFSKLVGGVGVPSK